MPRLGVEAKKLFVDAQKLPDQIVKERSLKANGVIAFFSQPNAPGRRDPV